MSKRTAKFVSAIFASLLAGTPLATVSHGATETADSCLSGPKGATPEGSHWYYRIDRATKRQCWYLKDENGKVSRAEPEDPSPRADAVPPPVSPPRSASTQRSIANARAELTSPQTRAEQEPNIFTGQRVPAAAAGAANLENNQPANAADDNAGRSVVASRWPEASPVSSSLSAATPTGDSSAMAQTNPETELSPAAAEVPVAAADAPSEKPSGSVQMLLIVMAGALAVAGVIGSAMFRFGGTRRAGRRDIKAGRRVNWDLARADRPSLSEEARATAPVPQVNLRRKANLPRELQAADDPDDRIAQMLARLARSAAT